MLIVAKQVHFCSKGSAGEDMNFIKQETDIKKYMQGNADQQCSNSN